MELENILRHIGPLPATALRELAGLARLVTFPKGHVLLKAHKVERSLYFIQKGIVRAFAPNEGSDITFWFGKEGDPILSMRSYVYQEPGYENIELLEDCALYRWDTQALQRLFENNVDIANWGRRLAERELIKTEERLIGRTGRSAQQRYQELLRESPELLQRISLGHIASYLGITPVSLSRIRSQRH